MAMENGIGNMTTRSLELLIIPMTLIFVLFDVDRALTAFGQGRSSCNFRLAFVLLMGVLSSAG
jgi:hypothetical protein